MACTSSVPINARQQFLGIKGYLKVVGYPRSQRRDRAVPELTEAIRIIGREPRDRITRSSDASGPQIIVTAIQGINPLRMWSFGASSCPYILQNSIVTVAALMSRFPLILQVGRPAHHAGQNPE